MVRPSGDQSSACMSDPGCVRYTVFDSDPPIDATRISEAFLPAGSHLNATHFPSREILGNNPKPSAHGFGLCVTFVTTPVRRSRTTMSPLTQSVYAVWCPSG